MAEEMDQELVGTVGRVTVPITPRRAGEVVLPVRGGTEAFAAISDDDIPKNSKIVVVECLAGRTVTVTAIG